jgi:hypothetical protein
MKRVLAVVIGLAIGVLLAGAVAPVLMVILPQQLRGPSFLWCAASVVVASAAWAAWLLSGPRLDS